MTVETAPDPYTMPEPPTSPGRAFLARAFAHWCAVEHGFSPEEVAAALDGRAVGMEVRRQVAEATRLIGEVFAVGGVRTWGRPIGGGLPQPLDAGLWELDDFRTRLATSAVSLARPFDGNAQADHWLFVDVEDFNALIEARFPEASTARRTGAVEPDAQARDAPPMGERNERSTGEPSASIARPERLIRLPEVMRMVGMSRSTIYQRILKGRFPAQSDESDTIASWRLSEIEDWIAKRG